MKEPLLKQSTTLVTLLVNRKRLEAGFTLLEMMLALAIFAGLSMAGMQLIQGGIASSEQTRQRSAELIALQKSLWVMEQDLSQIVIRAPQTGGNNNGVIISRGSQSSVQSIKFLRRNAPLPNGDSLSSGLIQVEWRWHHGKLMRRSWPSENKDDISEILMMEMVSRFDITLVPLSDNISLPAAVRVLLDTPQNGVIEHTVLLMETL